MTHHVRWSTQWTPLSVVNICILDNPEQTERSLENDVRQSFGELFSQISHQTFDHFDPSGK